MRIGSLFSGYGGLDLAAQQYFGGDLAWYSEIEPAACQILAAHHPITPNLGDITLVDWATVAPVDVLTGGYPCQPVSNAGKRKGSSDERHLWPFVATAIDALRPRVVVLENVRGHLTLGFGAVLADLHRMGYDASWGVVRASDAGAPHGRARIFIVAYPDIVGHERAGSARDGRAGSSYSDEPPSDTSGHEGWISDGDSEPPTDAISRVHGSQQEQSDPHWCGRGNPVTNWGKYGVAINRWERVLGRAAPDPTIVGGNGRPRLNPIFVEWMMGLDLAYVTGHGLRPAQELKALGNGVCPQQAHLALTMILGEAS